MESFLKTSSLQPSEWKLAYIQMIEKYSRGHNSPLTFQVVESVGRLKQTKVQEMKVASNTESIVSTSRNVTYTVQGREDRQWSASRQTCNYYLPSYQSQGSPELLWTKYSQQDPDL